MNKIQVKSDSLPFVLISSANAETLSIEKGMKVDVKIIGNEIRLVPVAPSPKVEPQGIARTLMEAPSNDTLHG